jgi:hypothetical protein
MNLPHDTKQHAHQPHKAPSSRGKWLPITAIILSLLSMCLVLYTTVTLPAQIDSYVQAHKSELKGADGRDGTDGVDGRNGVNGVNGASGRNSYSPTYCSSYDYGYGYSSTSCY